MEIQFFKYQGTGNDFVILDNRDERYNKLTAEQVAFLCHRRFGIGADGLMLLNAHPDFDFEMKYYNADGRESTMCGNGSRCLVQFARKAGIVQDNYRFLAVDGAHEAKVSSEGIVSIKMIDVPEVKFEQDHFVLNTGSPHFVKIEENVMAMDVFKKGREIRCSKPYEKEGINVNFVQLTDRRDKILVRTYERGVENETLSCGTGVTAAALVCFHNESGYNYVEVATKGGILNVGYDKQGNQYHNIWLHGPAQLVFEGKVTVKEKLKSEAKIESNN